MNGNLFEFFFIFDLDDSIVQDSVFSDCEFKSSIVKLEFIYICFYCDVFVICFYFLEEEFFISFVDSKKEELVFFFFVEEFKLDFFLELEKRLKSGKRLKSIGF